MKTFLSLLVIFLLSVLSVSVLAQAPEQVSADRPELPDAGVGPDNVLHGLELALERVRLELTPHPRDRAELSLRYAQERLAEAQAMQEKGKPELVGKALAEQKRALDRAGEAAQEARDRGEDTAELEQKMVAVHARNVEVLSGLLERVPEQAREAIRNAINRSQEGRQKAMMAGDAMKPEDAGDAMERKPDAAGAGRGGPEDVMEDESMMGEAMGGPSDSRYG